MENNFVQGFCELLILAMKHREFSDDSLRQRDVAVRFTAVVVATLVLALCSPAVNPPQIQVEPAPAMPTAPEQPERVAPRRNFGFRSHPVWRSASFGARLD
jgi:hypothetical protein